MASGESEVSICNLALSHIGEAPITSLSDNTNAARECNRLYASSRDMELRAHNWNFAIRRGNLAADGTAPDWGPASRYIIPSDCLRIIEVRDATDWRVEGGNLGDAGTVYIVTAWSGTLYIRYIARITDTAVFDTLFANTLAARLAMDLAPRLTQSNAVYQAAQSMHNMWSKQAKTMDAYESAPRQRPQSRWVSARNSGSWGSDL